MARFALAALLALAGCAGDAVRSTTDGQPVEVFTGCVSDPRCASTDLSTCSFPEMECLGHNGAWHRFYQCGEGPARDHIPNNFVCLR